MTGPAAGRGGAARETGVAAPRPPGSDSLLLAIAGSPKVDRGQTVSLSSHGPRRGIRLTTMSMSAAVALTISAGQAAADPEPSARDTAKSRQDVRERAAAVGRTKARLAQAGGELERLAATAELAMENYNGEVVRVEQAR